MSAHQPSDLPMSLKSLKRPQPSKQKGDARAQSGEGRTSKRRELILDAETNEITEPLSRGATPSDGAEGEGDELELLQGDLSGDLSGEFYFTPDPSEDPEAMSGEGEGGEPLAPARRGAGRRALSAKPQEGGADIALIDPLQRYLNEVRRYPLLTPAQEEHFSKLYYEQRDTKAAQKLVLSNLRLVVKIAMEYKRAWTDVMDLIQEGSIGLSEAVKRFDPYRGVRFSTFARFWIHALILQYILKNFSMFSFANTRAGRKLFFQLERERERLIKMYGRATNKMIAENLNVSEDEVRLIDLLKRPAIELDAPRGSGDDEAPPLIETLGDDEPTVEQQVIEQNLRDVFHERVVSFGATLTEEREVKIWRDRLTSEEPESLESIAQVFHVTRERIRQIEERVKERFRSYLEQDLGGEMRVFFGER